MTAIDLEKALDAARGEISKLPFDSGTSSLRSREIGDCRLWIGYSTGTKETYFHTNVDGDVLYLLTIQVAEHFRGRGYGDRLYDIVEDLAVDLGCREVRQTPSGWTTTKETRRSYLNRRGWIDDGAEVYKELI